ncbi:hypothetical protein VIGAN_01295600 [Vigna angularis var. angularis]|uniref:Uncharacterized protein n=1 Tax=Vigna angularis var. angularis TaxID=157739 RepID=A0A0S3R3M7_PHAAN|nr:hypothetical protein VIGAN_01295600 [Vigna angularis var. angularis]
MKKRRVEGGNPLALGSTGGRLDRGGDAMVVERTSREERRERGNGAAVGDGYGGAWGCRRRQDWKKWWRGGWFGEAWRGNQWGLWRRSAHGWRPGLRLAAAGLAEAAVCVRR